MEEIGVTTENSDNIQDWHRTWVNTGLEDLKNIVGQNNQFTIPLQTARKIAGLQSGDSADNWEWNHDLHVYFGINQRTFLAMVTNAHYDSHRNVPNRRFEIFPMGTEGRFNLGDIVREAEAQERVNRWRTTFECWSKAGNRMHCICFPIRSFKRVVEEGLSLNNANVEFYFYLGFKTDPLEIELLFTYEIRIQTANTTDDSRNHEALGTDTPIVTNVSTPVPPYPPHFFLHDSLF